jgi:hypothetical protein
MNLNYETILARANKFYREAKLEIYPAYSDEDFEIKSDQVKAILKALIEELNK